MGTDLIPLGNHKIKFKGRQFGELAQEIKAALEQTVFPNAEFLKQDAFGWHRSNPRMIRHIKAKKHWTFQEENEYFSFEKEKEIHFDGPFNLGLIFEENRITFRNPTPRYRHWFDFESTAFRYQWRKYLKQVVHLFGGDRVLYAADNLHFLDEYTDCECSFEEMENELKEKHGEPKKSFQEVADDLAHAYIIDYFEDIDWRKSESARAYSPEPDERSSIDYDLKKYATKDSLKKLNFCNEVLYHKRTDHQVYFYHLATVDGLLCIHTGQVDGPEKLEVILDEYAPFTYDDLEEKIKKEGYGNQCDKSFTIRIKEEEYSENWHNAIAEFNVELLWQGLGKRNGGIYEEEVKELRYDSVDEELALQLLLTLAKNYHAKGKIEVYRNHDDNDILSDNQKETRTLIYQQ